tara:strand:- start:179 stop:859 length:681 start_codon:yes stop_codon:yes gene_type:complete
MDNKMVIELLNQEFVDSYGQILKLKDSNYINEQRVCDKNGNPYNNGMAMLTEVPSRNVMMGTMLGDKNWTSEKPYLTIGAQSMYITDKRTKLDVFSEHFNSCIEYKKIKWCHNNGTLVEEYWKKMTHTGCIGSTGWRNPINNASMASESVFGDIEKLNTLPTSYNRASLLEVWGHSKQDIEPSIQTTLLLMERYFDVEIHRSRVEGLVHPYLDTCDIILTIVKGKK